ncbi:MAG: hypothetical protein ACYC21_06640 [Eubacteriales bacterium]
MNTGLAVSARPVFISEVLTVLFSFYNAYMGIRRNDRSFHPF